MDRVSHEFYHNILLLTKFVPPSEDFKKFFHEGMFDKPNTPAFVQLSHYLLNIYYKEHVKSKLTWPIVCKQTENKFRNDVKDCLQNIANDNPYMNFPPILASLFIVPKGTKFLLIMWKLSIVVLRVFLTRDLHTTILDPPKAGNYQEKTKIFLKSLTKDNCETTSKYCKSKEQIKEEKSKFKIERNNHREKYTAAIFKKKEELKKICDQALVNEVARKCLNDIKNYEIIDLYTKDVLKKIDSIDAISQELKMYNELIRYLVTIVLNITGNSKILNGLDLEKVSVDNLYRLLPPEKQVHANRLYIGDNIDLYHLFSILNIILQKYKSSSNMNVIHDWSKCQVQFQLNNKELKQLLIQDQQLLNNIELYVTQDLKRYTCPVNNQKTIYNIREGNDVVFLPSPTVDINYESVGSINRHDLKLTPVEGAHKKFLSRNNCSKNNAKKHFPVQRINFEDATLNESGNRILQFKKDESVRPKESNNMRIEDRYNKYSRIFSSRKPKSFNNSIISTLSGNSMLPLFQQEHSTSIDSCNSSQDFLPSLMKPNMNSTIEPSKEEKPAPKTSRRRSISDLVERYKKVIEKSEINSSHMVLGD